MKTVPKPELLAFTTRGDSFETLHEGWICVLNKDKKIVYQKGNIYDKVFLRSIAKPIQAIPVIDNNLKVNSKELAIISGSHTGSQKHIAILKSLLKKGGLSTHDLKCGIHLPFDEEERTRLLTKKIKSTILHNNCSGKHLGMLLVCKNNGWDLKTYLNPNHPLQKLILSCVQDLSETKNVAVAIDGCGAPIFAIPIINTAKIFSNFTNSKKYQKIINAMKQNPYLVGGKNQIDSEIIKASKGKLIAKVGAEGIIAVAYKGNSAIVKIADGSPKIRSFVMVKLLIKLGWLKKSEIKNSVLEEIEHGEVRNHAGKIVGKLIYC